MPEQEYTEVQTPVTPEPQKTEPVVKPEVTTPEPTQQAAPDPEELLARDSGWVPKEEWKGKPEDWRSAKEFNERGELFTRIKSQSKELNDLKQAMSFLTAQQRQQYLKGQQDAIANLRAMRDKALEAEDHVTAARVAEKLEDAKQDLKQATAVVNAPPKVEVSDTFRSWQEREGWYMKDKVLTRLADSIGLEFRDSNPGSTEADMLDHVSRELRKEYPHKFATQRQATAAPSPEGEGRALRGASNSGTNLNAIKSGMSEEHRSIMKTIMRATGMSEADYLKQYAG